MEKQEPKKKSSLKLIVVKYYKLITVLLVIVLIALSYNFILGPKYQEIKESSQYNLGTLQKNLATQERYLQDLKTMAANYKKISQTEINRLESLLPKEKDIDGLFVQLQALAESHNLLLGSVSINEAVKAKKVNIYEEEVVATRQPEKLSISLNLLGAREGDYGQIKEFLSTLENNLRLFDVDAVYFGSDSTDYSVNIVTYYLPE